MAEREDLNRETAEVRAEARGLIKTFGSTRKREAAATRKTLRSAVRTNRKVVGALLNEAQDTIGEFHVQREAMANELSDSLRANTAALTKEVINIRLDAKNMVAGFADERITRGIALSRMLKDYTDQISSDVGLMMADFEMQRIPVKKDLEEAHEIWLAHSRNETTAARPTAIKKAWKETTKPAHGRETGIKGEILTVVNDSPEGVSLANAGRKIGVEWRKLIKPAKELLNQGKIRKEESSYFPA